MIDTDIYDSAIKKLEAYKHLSSVKELVSKAEKNLRDQREEVEAMQAVYDEIPNVLARLRDHPPETLTPLVKMAIIIQGFLSKFTVKNQPFLSFDESLYSLGTQSGCYTFRVRCYDPDIVVFQRLAKQQPRRRGRSNSFIFYEFPALDGSDTDCEILKDTYDSLRISWKDTWRHLTFEETPANSSDSEAASAELSDDEANN